jgi:hypothetical protein
MGLQTPFDKPIYGNTSDLSGDLPTARGNDPNISVDGSSALKTPFDKPIDGSMDSNETANSVSGLPLQPQRYQPSETPPEPPTLKDRNPGTIDQ